MKYLFLFVFILTLASCAKKTTTSSSSKSLSEMIGQLPPSAGHTRTITVEYLDQQTYRLTETTEDKTYGYDAANPVKVGGAMERSGPQNERRFLNALTGPNGEEVTYTRTHSCCPFNTPNSAIGGMLDVYKVSWKGGKDVTIYINMYDEGDLRIPVGFRAKK